MVTLRLDIVHVSVTLRLRFNYVPVVDTLQLGYGYIAVMLQLRFSCVSVTFRITRRSFSPYSARCDSRGAVSIQRLRL